MIEEWTTPRRGGRRRRSHKGPVIAGIVVLALVVGYVVFAATRSTTYAPEQTTRRITVASAPLKPAWPAYGQSALALGAGPIVASHGSQRPAATASTAKLITCLVVLAKRPLRSGQDGPTLTMTAADVRSYNRYVAEQGSVTAVRAGQRLTERDVLEGILLPSANNLADTLAIWAFGSLPGYRAAATSWVQAHELTHTRIGSDASGFSPDTVSTADDLVRLGQLTMANAVLRTIVGENSAQLPEDGTVYNVDTILGGGIVGVKTGNSDQNGGVFVGAAEKRVAGRTITVVSAISGAPSLDAALHDSRLLLQSATRQLVARTVVAKGSAVGSYDTADGTVAAIAAKDVSIVQFGAAHVAATVTLRTVSPGAAGRTVGSVAVDGTSQRADVTLRDAVAEPSLWHKLIHP